jgi:hypothetical protein
MQNQPETFPFLSADHGVTPSTAGVDFMNQNTKLNCCQIHIFVKSYFKGLKRAIKAKNFLFLSKRIFG